MKFEYVVTKGKICENLQEHLNTFGEMGFDIAHVSEFITDAKNKQVEILVILKRAIEDDE